MRARKPHKFLAWALLDEDRLALTDARLNVFWLRRIAEAANKELLAGQGKVVRVTVSLAPKPKKTRRRAA